jgi:four helix bundle protein
VHDPALSEKPPTFEGGQDIRDRVFAFACRVVKFCQTVYEGGGVGRMLVPQLVNCSTSSATMLEEARAAESKPDFISKCSISLKELRESWTRLRVCEACRLGPHQAATDLVRESNELIAIVTRIIRNTKRNANITGRGGQRCRTNSKFLIPNSKF